MSTPTLAQLLAAPHKIVRVSTSKYRDGDRAINEVFQRTSDNTFWLVHRCESDEHDVSVIQVAPVETRVARAILKEGDAPFELVTSYHEVRA